MEAKSNGNNNDIDKVENVDKTEDIGKTEKIDKFEKIGKSIDGLNKKINGLSKNIKELTDIDLDIRRIVNGHQQIIKESTRYITENMYKVEVMSKVLNSVIPKLENLQSVDTSEIERALDEEKEKSELYLSEIENLRSYCSILEREKADFLQEKNGLESKVRLIEGDYHQQQIQYDHVLQNLENEKEQAELKLLKALIKSTQEEYQNITANLNETEDTEQLIMDCKDYFSRLRAFMKKRGFVQIGEASGFAEYDSKLHQLIEGNAEEGDRVFIHEIGWMINGIVYKRAMVYKIESLEEE